MELVTQRLKLKDIRPDIADAISKEYNISSEDLPLVRKGIVSSDLKFEEGERAVISYITTGAKDRDDEIVDPGGVDLSHYRKHPVVLFGHDYSKLPVGKNVWIKEDEKGLIAKTVYAKHDEADKVYQYRKDGFPLAESIGFVPLSVIEHTEKEKSANGGVKRTYTKTLLLEYSDVAVPSNPEALQVAISKGLVPKEATSPEEEVEIVKEAVEMVEEVVEVPQAEASPAPEEISSPSDSLPEGEAQPIGTPQEPAPEAPAEEIPPAEPEEKSLSPDGSLSVDDIKEAICSSLESLYPGAIVSCDCCFSPILTSESSMMPAQVFIEDLFPYNYPNGNVIVEVRSPGQDEILYMYPYTINNSGSALLGKPTEVQESYTPVKGADRTYTKEFVVKEIKPAVSQEETIEIEDTEEKSFKDMIEIDDSFEDFLKSTSKDILSSFVNQAFSSSAKSVDEALRRMRGKVF